VSKLVENYAPQDKVMQLTGLMHDASEAYLGDVSTPLKTVLPEYRKLEEKFQEVIRRRFGLYDIGIVKVFDSMALEFESKTLMGPRHPIWDGYKPEYPKDFDLDYTLTEIKPMSAIDVELEFLTRFNTLWRQQ
jgi:hypothetical protein